MLTVTRTQAVYYGGHEVVSQTPKDKSNWLLECDLEPDLHVAPVLLPRSKVL